MEAFSVCQLEIRSALIRNFYYSLALIRFHLTGLSLFSVSHLIVIFFPFKFNKFRVDIYICALIAYQDFRELVFFACGS